MNYVQFPFPDRAILQVKNDSSIRKVECELASSDIQIFQSLSYRKKKDFKLPLVLIFTNPFLQSFSLQNFSFPVEQICVACRENKVKKISVIYPGKESGNYVQGFSEFSLVVLAQIGYFKKYKLIENKTIIKSLN
jgi:hypothetical protein